ncbi:hypothetical protein PMAYCL1PPCAC_19582, partial [Pristionchus mayeri]
RQSPPDRATSHQFFATIDARTEDEFDLIDWFLSNNKRVNICMKHFKKDGLSDEKNALCDVCGQEAFPFLISPGDSSLAWDFLNHLIGLTPTQRAKINFIVKNNRRVLICRRHYRDERRGETTEEEEQTDEPGPSRKW